MSSRRQFVHSMSVAALGAALPFTVLAQALEQVKILYGFPAGSSGDSVARRVGENMAGSSFTTNAAVVENKTGAGGRIALEALKSSAADGSVLAVSPFSAVAIYPHIYKNMRYAPEDFAPVSIAAIMHHGLAVGPLVPASVKTLKDFLAWAKANPDQASFGSPGAGSTPHFIGALLGIQSGTPFKHIPYRGSVPGVTDVVGGQLAAMVTPSGDFIPNYKAGKLRILATSGTKRSPYLPDVPTFAEAGFPDLTTEEWFGFFAPARTPAKVVAAANAAVNQALTQQSVLDSLAVVGLIPQGSTQEGMARSIKAEYDRWGPLVKQIGFTPES